MPSRVVQLDERHLPTLASLGIPHKDVTERERHLKLTINQLKCELAGDSARYSVVDKDKFVRLSRIATLARGLPLEELARREPAAAAALEALAGELRALDRPRPGPEA